MKRRSQFPWLSVSNFQCYRLICISFPIFLWLTFSLSASSSPSIVGKAKETVAVGKGKETHAVGGDQAIAVSLIEEAVAVGEGKETVADDVGEETDAVGGVVMTAVVIPAVRKESQLGWSAQSTELWRHLKQISPLNCGSDGKSKKL